MRTNVQRLDNFCLWCNVWCFNWEKLVAHEHVHMGLIVAFGECSCHFHD